VAWPWFRDWPSMRSPRCSARTSFTSSSTSSTGTVLARTFLLSSRSTCWPTDPAVLPPPGLALNRGHAGGVAHDVTPRDRRGAGVPPRARPQLDHGQWTPASRLCRPPAKARTRTGRLAGLRLPMTGRLAPAGERPLPAHRRRWFARGGPSGTAKQTVAAAGRCDDTSAERLPVGTGSHESPRASSPLNDLPW
jgi:hypothetical protein